MVWWLAIVILLLLLSSHKFPSKFFRFWWLTDLSWITAAVGWLCGYNPARVNIPGTSVNMIVSWETIWCQIKFTEGDWRNSFRTKQHFQFKRLEPKVILRLWVMLLEERVVFRMMTLVTTTDDKSNYNSKLFSMAVRKRLFVFSAQIC